MLLAARGFPPEYRGNGHLFLTASREEIERAYDDIMAWLGFASQEDYHAALSAEGPAVFQRAAEPD